MKEKGRDSVKQDITNNILEESICVQEISIAFYFRQLDHNQNLLYTHESS